MSQLSGMNSWLVMMSPIVTAQCFSVPLILGFISFLSLSDFKTLLTLMGSLLIECSQ